MQTTKTWIHSLIYITLITLTLYLIHTLILLETLTISPNKKITLKKHSNLPLRFDSNGRFKILQVADMHYGNGLTRCRDVLSSQFDACSDANTTLFLKKMIDVEKPDFIAFTDIKPYFSIKQPTHPLRDSLFSDGCQWLPGLIQRENKAAHKGDRKLYYLVEI